MSWWKTLREVITNWGLHRCSTHSAALAFYTIFSLAPILVVVIALAGAVWGEEAVRGQIFQEFEGLMGRDATRLVEEVVASAARPASGRITTAIGIITLLFGATGVFGQLQDALNTVWSVAPKPGANLSTLLRKRLHSFALIVGIGFLLLVSLVLSAGLTGFSRYLERVLDLPVDFLQVANFAVSFAVITLLFAMTYRILPDVKVAWRDVWLGSLLTALLFVSGKTLIGLYLGSTSVASAYGAAGSLVVILLWVYYSSLIFFFGAEFTRVHSRQFRVTRAQPEEGAVRVPEGQGGAVAQQ
ncbi:MAG TPA: YihY/virulence factor BrkB family protein [Thermoanaerobaculia bacterium]|nr:YihY/virulence factor BrkB family protein [Thermoanaerobaculia bacterium]